MSLTAILGFVIGSQLGSFIEAISGRVIKNRSIWGRSYCLECKKKIREYDLFPILSYLLLKGRCRNCHKKIPPETILVELITAVLVAVLFYFHAPSLDAILKLEIPTVFQLLNLLLKLFTLVILEIVFITDLRAGLIFDKITYPASIIAALYLIVTTAVKSILFYQSLIKNPFGKYLLPPQSAYFYNQLQRLWLPIVWSLATAVSLAAFFILLIMITKGKGMGQGDVKYVFFLGLALGFPLAVEATFLAFFIGAIVSLMLILLSKKRLNQTIPFGPFLSLGTLLSLLWGQKILDFYFKLGY